MINIKKYFKRYNLDISKIIGYEYLNKNNNKILNKYYFNTKTKVIRIFHDELQQIEYPICTYIDMEEVLSMRITLAKSTFKKINNIETFIKTKIYTELEINEITEYIFKYKIIEIKTTENNIEQISIDVVFIPKEKFTKLFENELKKIGYIDYISFPAFSYEILYKINVLENMRDLFVVILWDKTYLTIYEDGKYVYNGLINFGLQTIYNALNENFEIEGFNKEVLYLLLKNKGLKKEAYFDEEKEIYNELNFQFNHFYNILNENLIPLLKEYKISNLDRIFITSNYGNILNIEKHIEEKFNIRGKNFDFYEKFNPDNLNITPFLFLSMLETYDSFLSKKFDNENNFSLWKRPKTFFYRPLGKLTLSFFTSVIISLCMYSTLNIIKNNLVDKKKILETKIVNINNQKLTLTIKNNELIKLKKEKIKKLKDIISQINNKINILYYINTLKYSKKLQTSNILYNISKEIYKNNLKIKNIQFNYLKNTFDITILSNKKENLIKFLNYLKSKNWKFNNKFIIIKENKEIFDTKNNTNLSNSNQKYFILNLSINKENK